MFQHVMVRNLIIKFCLYLLILVSELCLVHINHFLKVMKNFSPLLKGMKDVYCSDFCKIDNMNFHYQPKKYL